MRYNLAYEPSAIHLQQSAGTGNVGADLFLSQSPLYRYRFRFSPSRPSSHDGQDLGEFLLNACCPNGPVIQHQQLSAC